jgi:hypothetical protein
VTENDFRVMLIAEPISAPSNFPGCQGGSGNRYRNIVVSQGHVVDDVAASA